MPMPLAPKGTRGSPTQAAVIVGRDCTYLMETFGMTLDQAIDLLKTAYLYAERLPRFIPSGDVESVLHDASPPG